MASGEVCWTLPTTTWPTSSAGTPEEASAALAAWTASSVADTDLKAPVMVPKGVRRAARITTSRESFAMGTLISVGGMRAGKLVEIAREGQRGGTHGGGSATELGVAVGEHGFAGLAGGGAGPDPVAVHPAVREQGVAGPHGLGEARTHVADAGGVAVTGTLGDGPGHVAVGAQPVKDRPALEACDQRKVGIGVQGIEVAGQTVQQRLLGRDRLFDVEVGLARGRRGLLGGRRIPAKATLPQEQNPPLRVEQGL